ncbi:MAG: TetR/AcrR family transcriptional regulator [Flavobacteriales bacterium]
MNEKFTEILQKAKEVFMRLGLKSVTMDDVSRELGISKKTLYQFVSDKNDLIIKSVELDLQENKCKVDAVMSMDENAIDQLLMVNNVVSEKMKQVHPSILFDMQKYYPEAWRLLIEHRQSYVVEIIAQNLKLGIAQGIYRQNLNIELIARLYTSKMEILSNEILFPIGKFGHDEVITEFMKYHFYGVVNEKGKQYLELILNQISKS